MPPLITPNLQLLPTLPLKQYRLLNSLLPTPFHTNVYATQPISTLVDIPVFFYGAGSYTSDVVFVAGGYVVFRPLERGKRGILNSILALVVCFLREMDASWEKPLEGAFGKW